MRTAPKTGTMTEADWNRRRFLRYLSGGVLGSGLADVQALAAAATRGGQSAPAKNVLVIYEEGGISHMDTWDPKPDQVAEHRSPYAPIATNVPGIRFTSLMPQIARQADKLAVVRSMTSRSADHRLGCMEFFKGYRHNAPIHFPDIGAVVTHEIGSPCAKLPGYVFVPGSNMPSHVTGTGFLPRSRAAWQFYGNDMYHCDLSDPKWTPGPLLPYPGLEGDRIPQRRQLLEQLERPGMAGAGAAQSLRRHFETAHTMLSSPQTQAAFEFSRESDRLRDRYGRGHRGHCYLLGRKLIEAGVRFVTVMVIEPPAAVGREAKVGTPNGVFLNWDHHESIYKNGPCGGPQAQAGGERYGLSHPTMMPSVDRAFSALLEDMHQRGLLRETLVCFVTEMGRTPYLNKWQGRDHWGRALSIAFAGAGVPGGQVIGATNKSGGDVTDNPYTPFDYAETLYRKLGIDTHRQLRVPGDGRPVDFSDGGRPIKELF